MPPTVNVTTTTNQYLAPRWVNLVLRDNLFFAKILKNPRQYRGSQMNIPIQYKKGVPSIAFNGFDVLPITQEPVTVNMTFYPSFVATNVALSGTELSINQAEGNGALQTLKLIDTMMESRSQTAADDVGNYLQGDGTGDGGKAPMGLAGIVDDGSTLANYGGLSRATYSGLNATVTPSGGVMTLLKIRQLNNSISDGPISPDMLITDYGTWANFEKLQNPFQRNNYTDYRNMEAGTGYNVQRWGGMEIYRDKKVKTGNFYQLNTDFLKFHSLKFWQGKSVSPDGDDIVGTVYGKSGYSVPSAFTWTNFIHGYNQAAINGFMIFGGQLICEAPFRQGVLTGITSA